MSEVKTGLIMEGGAMRGLFTCGVIDVFMEEQIEFDGAVGISAGAVFGCNYKSRQIGRPRRYNERFCRDKRYGTVHSLLTSGDLFNVDFCYRLVPEVLDVFDIKAYRENPMKFYVGATDLETGKAVFHDCQLGDGEDTQWMRASASMPLVSRPVEINGRKYLDGGIADSIPLAFMESQGYNRNVVILTQPAGFVKTPNKAVPAMKLLMKQYPNAVDAMEKRHLVYNEQVRQVEAREAEGTAFVVRPPESLNISRTEKDPQELERVYQIGRAEAKKVLPAVIEFLRKEKEQPHQNENRSTI